jgi:hypothetical protein
MSSIILILQMSWIGAGTELLLSVAQKAIGHEATA